MSSAAVAARRLLRVREFGVLSTSSLRYTGHPFGSVTPYVLDHDGCPVLLLSRLAEHTRNLLADPRASLLVHESGPDVQAAARVTLVAEGTPFVPDAALRERFCRYVASARDLLALGDFSFFRLRPAAALYVGGFGIVHWITPAQYAPSVTDIGPAESEIVEYLNAHHPADLRACCRRRLGAEPAHALFLGLDCEGFDARADEVRLRFDFGSPARGVQQARHTLMTMVQKGG